MATASRGRRALSGELGLLDAPASERPEGPAPRRTVARSRRLPNDGTILSAMFKRLFKWVIRLAGAFLVLSVGMVVIYRFVNPPVTPLMIIRSLEGLGSGHIVWIDKTWVPIEKINPILLQSLIAAEDSRFLTHNGIDWKAVDEAEKRNKASNGTKLYGASTITMQCARNVFLWQGRNYVRKGLEAYFTYLTEFVWGKKRILEVYANVIEWGDGVYGIDAAAHKYFNTSADKLTAHQSALLAAILPNPRVFSPTSPTGPIAERVPVIEAGAPTVAIDALKINERKTPTPTRKNR